LADLDLDPIWLTLRLALTATPLLLVLGTPLAWWLARTESRLRHPIEAVVALPLVLPPTVLGFYLLLLLGPHGPIGQACRALGLDLLVFSFSGLVVGSMLYSLPFVVQPLQGAFEAVGRRPLEVAATLGASPLDRFVTVAVPLARRGFLTAGTLAFAHTLGEFGVVLMIGGNIPGRTRVLSIAIYDHVERLEYLQAHRLSLAMLVFSFLVLWCVYALNRRGEGLRTGATVRLERDAGRDDVPTLGHSAPAAPAEPAESSKHSESSP
jgi:molybdate transport system permease protein